MDTFHEGHDTGLDDDKITRIINKEFKSELEIRDKQLELIEERINQAQKTLHILKYVIASTYYSKAEKKVSLTSPVKSESSNATPKRLHPAIKKLLTGFTENTFVTPSTPRKAKQQALDQCKQTKKLGSPNVIQSKDLPVPDIVVDNEKTRTDNNIESYVPRNRNKKNYTVIVGNISKWMPAENEEDKSTHKWMMYVRGPKDKPDISHFVQKVVFYLHPSYKPHDVVEIKYPPFHLARRGWGEFPLRVRIYFIRVLNKPVDIIHQLKLDKTFTGRQTLGNETVINLLLYPTNNVVETTTSNKTNPDTIYMEHEYPIDVKEEVVEDTNLTALHDYIASDKEDLIDDKHAIALDHAYCSMNTVKQIAPKIEQPENQLIYGLKNSRTSPEPAETVIQETIVDYSDITTALVTLTNNKRKFSEPTVPLPKKQCRTVTQSSSKFQVKIDRKKYKNVLQVLPFLFKHLPIITKLARNELYKCTYPYVAANLEEYTTWNIGRRLSAEWFQAKTILNLVKLYEIPECEAWTTKRIIMYARSHGYTPLANYSIFKEKEFDYQYNHIPKSEENCIKKPILPIDELIEVTDTQKVSEKTEKYSKFIQLIDLNVQKASSYLKHAVLDVGVILKPEEIVPGVFFNAAERVLLQSTLCFAEDIIRKARAKLVYTGNFKEESSILTSNFIYEALNSRSEFKFLFEPSDMR